MCRCATLRRWFARPSRVRLSSLAADAGPDLRDYRVDFSKLTGTFPELDLRWNVAAGVDELVRAYTDYDFSHDDFVSVDLMSGFAGFVSCSQPGLIDEMLRRQPGRSLSTSSEQLTHELA